MKSCIESLANKVKIYLVPGKIKTPLCNYLWLYATACLSNASEITTTWSRKKLCTAQLLQFKNL